MQVDEPKGNGVTSTLVEANNGMQVEEAKDVLPSPPENIGQEVSDGPLPPAEVPTKVLSPAEIAMEKVKKSGDIKEGDVGRDPSKWVIPWVSHGLTHG